MQVVVVTYLKSTIPSSTTFLYLTGNPCYPVQVALPSESSLINFVASTDLIHRINEFRYHYRFSSRARAIRWLIDAALRSGLHPEPGEKITDASSIPPVESSG